MSEDEYEDLQKEIERDRILDVIKELFLYAFLLSLCIFGVVLLCKEVMNIILMARYL